MNILNLIQCANLGGMEQASLRLMRGLQARGHDVRLLSLNPIGRLGPLLSAARIPHDGLPYAGWGGWRILRRLRRELKRNSAEALLMTGHHLAAMSALGDIAKGRRVLAIHFHHTGVKPNWQWRLIYHLACARFQAITFPSDFIRREAERIYPPVAAWAWTIRNPLFVPPLPTPEQKQAARRSLGLPPGVPIVGNAGWLIPRKRFDVFLRTAAVIAVRCPETHFVIAGDGPERSRLETMAGNLNLSDRLTWTGWVPNMDDFFCSLDVLLFHSDWDAMGNTPLEAMSYGIPVVASVINGGLKEVLSAPEYGFLLDRHETDTLAKIAADLAEDSRSAKTLGMAGRERIRRMSNPEAVATEYEALLTSGMH